MRSRWAWADALPVAHPVIATFARLTIAYGATGVVDVGCTGCGATDSVSAEDMDDMLSGVKAFMDAHAVCAQRALPRVPRPREPEVS